MFGYLDLMATFLWWNTASLTVEDYAKCKEKVWKSNNYYQYRGSEAK
jgi:hypothetical protein